MMEFHNALQLESNQMITAGKTINLTTNNWTIVWTCSEQLWKQRQLTLIGNECVGSRDWIDRIFSRDVALIWWYKHNRRLQTPRI
jgi:hypothetical protein